MKAKPQKRYFTEKEITEQIDRAHEEAFLSLQKAERYEAEYHAGIRVHGISQERKDELAEIKKAAKKLRAKHARIHNNKLPRLGDRLATFRTPTFETVTTDRSITQ